ncbi:MULTISPECIES: gluconate 2-dehydrogenase subunit 3 family protein [unclassified Pseudoalteromonas]|uniref:gluconate 2-dehydrogenase subunit 3 family protein n=1 Tax=unclassified Pseudoalteromonas TaxID=194690 RepID=UPI000CF670D2|nr:MULTISPECIES: gluconate 2-dehydrogenase subunit 3 family protein [unclassified Pseudoalteromonas]MBS3796262.1 gluconate 2-dehydrogenase subunit 3 family protein [Pseudoalteromonas sp. BDTF-M6]
MHHHDRNNPYQYKSGMTRRESLKWLGLLAAGSAVTLSGGCSKALEAGVAGTSNAGHWPALNIKPVTATGYGTDPNMIMPPQSPWPLTLSAAQLTLVAILADWIVPREGDIPSASELEVPGVIDEWVSAPYEGQQRDRITILHALAWIDDEAQLRFKAKFAALSRAQQQAIIDDIAYYSDDTPEQFKRIGKAFWRFKELVLGAFFCSPEGCKDIGYLGNVPIAGDYPGPNAEAKAHLDKVLDELGLSSYAYQD